MNKMRQFQDLGHQVLFIVGDFTAQIGDPSGQSNTRSVVTRQQIEEGARTYADQAFKILDRDRTQVVYNSEWLAGMKFDQVIGLAGKYTLARMMERDDFKKRWAEHQSISIHELLYPLAQAYDSVVLQCDVELGGTDQLFNLMVGREIMREMGQQPQIVMTMPILEGINARLEGGKIAGVKMSKSLDNYVGVAEPPKEQFGKLMSISDDLMWRYYNLLSIESSSTLEQRKQACTSGKLNPRDAKIALAKEIVSRYHGTEAAVRASDSWLTQFSKKQVPDDIQQHEVILQEESIWIPKLLSDIKLVKSSSEGRRRIQQGGVEIDGQRINNPQAKLHKGGPYVLRAGKRSWASVTLK